MCFLKKLNMSVAEIFANCTYFSIKPCTNYDLKYFIIVCNNAINL